MAINADTLLDRLYLKSQVSKWRILAIVFAILALIVGTERFSPNSPIEKDFIARLTFDGFIDDDQAVYDLIDDVADNPKAKAVVLWLDTPGGSAVGGEETFVHLRALAERKPVVAVMRSVSASAGYMIALGADYIVAREGTITGSIGVLLETAEITELAEKIGVKPIVIKSSPLKGSPSPLEKSTPESEKVLYDAIYDFYNRFVDIVSERRGLAREQVVTIADGRVYGGRRATELKLVDAIGGEQEAVEWLTSQKKIKSGLPIKDIAIEPERDWLNELTQSVAGNFFSRSPRTLDGLLAIWHPELH